MVTRHYKNHKNNTIRNWKNRNVLSNDFDKLYENHMNINNCELCNIKFNKDILMERKCLDHDHATGLYRQTICHKCNIHFDNKIRKNNKLGHKNIHFDKSNNIYIFIKTINKKTTKKYFKTLTEALVYKFIQICLSLIS